ncbi:MAG TPA: hypothetical protein VJ508_07070, partial [Saprospiraceae bacterium]|nr:hypothetical protein [Saprospiraceae bacterium]
MIKYDHLQGGHFVRFIDIPVENFGDYGVFENLHHFNNVEQGGKKFAQLLEQNTHKYYGTGLEHFVKQLQENWDESREYLSKWKGVFYNVLTQNRKISNEVGRVLEVFSHVIASAELATKLGVHGDYLKPNDIVVACKNVIFKWIEWRGGIEAKFDETRILKILQT